MQQAKTKTKKLKDQFCRLSSFLTEKQNKTKTREKTKDIPKSWRRTEVPAASYVVPISYQKRMCVCACGMHVSVWWGSTKTNSDTFFVWKITRKNTPRADFPPNRIYFVLFLSWWSTKQPRKKNWNAQQIHQRQKKLLLHNSWRKSVRLLLLF